MSIIDAKHMDKYIDGKLVEKGKKDEPDEFGKHYWWKVPKGKSDETNLANQIWGTIRFIQSHQSGRSEQLTVDTRLYGNSSTFNLLGSAFTRAASVNTNPGSQRISYNLCASAVDTLTAHVAKNKIIPTFTTEKGNWKKQKQAQQLSQFSEGMFYEQKVPEKLTYQFRDAGVWGTGILHPYRDNDRACIERAYPHEFFVDLVECLSGPPRQLHRVKIIDREILIEMCPESKDDIEKMSPAPLEFIGGQGTAADLVMVGESWHLPSSPTAKDGRRVFSSPECIFVDREWKYDYFPFVFQHYSKDLLGFWGTSCCQRLQNLQGEINRLMILIQRSMWMGGSFKVLLKYGSKVVSQHINNDVGAIIWWQGDVPPQYITPPMIQQDIYPYVNELIQKGYRQEGISEMNAAGVKPMGLDSGKAIRAYNDIAKDRQLFIGQLIEGAALEANRQLINITKEIYDEKKTYTVIYPATRFIQSIDWKDIKLKEDDYVLKAFPTSSLKDDFSGKLQDVQEGMAAGIISPRLGKRLMRTPDVEMSDSLEQAAEDLIHKVIEEMLEESGKYHAPEPTMDLQLAQELSLEYINYAQYMNAPDDRVQLLRNFLDQVKTQLASAQAAMQPPQPQPQLPQQQAQQAQVQPPASLAA